MDRPNTRYDIIKMGAEPDLRWLHRMVKNHTRASPSLLACVVFTTAGACAKEHQKLMAALYGESVNITYDKSAAGMLYAGSSTEKSDYFMKQLRRGDKSRVRVLFTTDLFSRGVNLPFDLVIAVQIGESLARGYQILQRAGRFDKQSYGIVYFNEKGLLKVSPVVAGFLRPVHTNCVRVLPSSHPP
jgi:superfamily II DNA/RNA helicase